MSKSVKRYILATLIFFGLWGLLYVIAKFMTVKAGLSFMLIMVVVLAIWGIKILIDAFFD
jgi:hypothetical protein